MADRKPTEKELSKAGSDLQKADGDTPVTKRDSKAGSDLQRGRRDRK